MIVQAFLRWIETAKTQERCRAAHALARAYLQSSMTVPEQRAALVAMTYLLDDPSPQVRHALASALSTAAHAPRALVVALAEDQPDIASCIILFSPVLTESDLVDIAARGTAETRALVAARGSVPLGVAAALAEIAESANIEILLENSGAELSPFTLRRIAERHGTDSCIRALLLARDELTAEVRQLILQFVVAALQTSGFVQGSVGCQRIERITREASENATICLLGEVHGEELRRLAEQLRLSGRLTPIFLMLALCAGRTDFFATALVAISGMEERRVRSILATGRFHAVRALMEAAGIDAQISPIFVDAVMQWRQLAQRVDAYDVNHIGHHIVDRYRGLAQTGDAGRALLDAVERFAMSHERQLARDYASTLSLAAA